MEKEDLSPVENVTGEGEGDDDSDSDDMKEFTKNLQDKLERVKVAVAVEEEAELKNRYRAQRDLVCTQHVKNIKMLEETVEGMKKNLITSYAQEYPGAFEMHYSFSTDEQVNYYETLCQWHRELGMDK